MDGAVPFMLSKSSLEIAQSDGCHFFTVFQLCGQSVMEQGEQQAVLSAGDITLIVSPQRQLITNTHRFGFGIGI